MFSGVRGLKDTLRTNELMKRMDYYPFQANFSFFYG